MRLSQSVTYAIHAVLRLAEHQRCGPVSCGRLAEEGHMPERFLLQILRDLARQGILQSTRGGGGGFMLERRPEDITLLEVIEAIDGPLCSGLPRKANFPEKVADRLQAALARIAEETRRHLHQIRISELAVSAASVPGSSDRIA